MASLIVMKSPNPEVHPPGERIRLLGDQVILGRSPDCQVHINNHAVSRQHAQITAQNGQFFIEDLNSRNGTFVNSQKVTAKTALRNDDRVKICDVLYRFSLDVPAAAPVAPLPASLRGRAAEEPDDGAQMTVEATLHRAPPSSVLEAQPAEKLRALLDISTKLSKSLDQEVVLPQIADSLFSVFRQADRCFVILRDEATGQLVAPVAKSRRPSQEEARFSRTIVRKCLETQESFLSEDASSNQQFGMAMSIAEFRIRSVMCVPMVTPEGQAVGVIQLDTQDRVKKFTQDDLKLLTAVAGLAAVAVDNARLHEAVVVRSQLERDMESARKVQFCFLPRTLPAVAGYDFFAFYSPAQMVGGDYYDFIPLDGGRVALLLGDVAGKGMPAAMLMAKLSAEARQCMLTEPDYAVALAKLNDVLTPVAAELDRFVTLALAVLHPDRHAAAVLNAAQMNPMVFRAATGDVEEAITSAQSGLMLGVVEGMTYEAVDVALEPGDVLFIFTDGVSDALSPDNQMFGLEGVRAALVGDEVLARESYTATTLGQKLVAAVRKHADGREQNDDIAVVAVGRVPAKNPADTSGPSSGVELAPLLAMPDGPATQPLKTIKDAHPALGE